MPKKTGKSRKSRKSGTRKSGTRKSGKQQRSRLRNNMDGGTDYHHLVILYDDGAIRSHKITNSELQTINSIEDLKSFVKSKLYDNDTISRVVDIDDNDMDDAVFSSKKDFMINQAQKPQKIMFHVKEITKSM